MLSTQASANIADYVEPSSSQMPNSKMVLDAAVSVTRTSQLFAPSNDAPNAVQSVIYASGVSCQAYNSRSIPSSRISEN